MGFPKATIPQEAWTHKNSLCVGRHFRAGYESQLLDTLKYDSVTAALAALNAKEVDCRSLCLVHSHSKKGYYILWPSWKTKKEVDEFVFRYGSSPVSTDIESFTTSVPDSCCGTPRCVSREGAWDKTAFAAKSIPLAEAQTMTMKDFSVDKRDVKVISDPSGKTRNEGDEVALNSSSLSEVSTIVSTPEHTTTVARSTSRADESSTSIRGSGDGNTIAVATKKIPLWNSKNTLGVGKYFRAGYEPQLLDMLKYDSVSAALAALNSGEVRCQNVCFVLSRTRKEYYMLWPSWKTKKEVDEFAQRYFSSKVSTEVQSLNASVTGSFCSTPRSNAKAMEGIGVISALATKLIPLAEAQTMTMNEFLLDQRDVKVISDPSGKKKKEVDEFDEKNEVKVLFSFYQRDVEVISDPSAKTKKEVDKLAERYRSSMVIEEKVNLNGVQGGADSEVSTIDSTPDRTTADAMSTSRAVESATDEEVDEAAQLVPPEVEEVGEFAGEAGADSTAEVATEIHVADVEEVVEDSTREANVAQDSSTEAVPRRHRITDADKDPSLLPPDAPDNEKAKRFYNAAAVLEEDEDAMFSDGTIWTERQCLCTAVTLNPNFGSAYYNLGACLKGGEQISLIGFDGWCNKKLWIRAIDCDPDSRCEWWTLAEDLEDGGEVHFDHDDGSPWDRHRLLLRCITFAKGEKITMGGAEECSLQDVYLRAIEADPTFPFAYSRLGKCLRPGQRITLPDGAEVTADQLLAKAAVIDPHSLEGNVRLESCLEAVREESDDEFDE